MRDLEGKFEDTRLMERGTETFDLLLEEVVAGCHYILSSTHPAERVDPWIHIDKVEREHQLASPESFPFKQREILLLRYVEEMKVDDIAHCSRFRPAP